jgi:hypothetical protein
MARTRMSKSSNSGKPRLVTVQQVRQMINSNLEHKTETFVLGATTWATAGIVYSLTQKITEGSDINNRDGTEIIVKRMRFKLVCTAPTTGATGVIGRVIIFADQLAQGGAPAVLDLLDTASYVSSYAPTNVQRNRFKVIYDKPITAVPTAANAVVMRELVFKMNHKVFYSGTGDTTGANGKGAIFALFISNNQTNTPQYDFSVETTFTDA